MQDVFVFSLHKKTHYPQFFSHLEHNIMDVASDHWQVVIDHDGDDDNNDNVMVMINVMIIKSMMLKICEITYITYIMMVILVGVSTYFVAPQSFTLQIGQVLVKLVHS